MFGYCCFIQIICTYLHLSWSVFVLRSEYYRKHIQGACSRYFIYNFLDIFPLSMLESSTFIFIFSLEHCWTIIWHLCPFWNQLFFQPSHLQPRTAFLFMSVRHLMSNPYALMCRLPNNPPGLMLCNPVTVSNISLMLPGGAKISRSDSNGLCACSCIHKLGPFLSARWF